MYVGTHTRTCYAYQILMKIEFSLRFFEKYVNINFHEIRALEAELFYADEQIAMTKLVVVLPNFAKAPKNMSVLDPADVPVCWFIMTWQKCSFMFFSRSFLFTFSCKYNLITISLILMPYN